MVIQVNEGTLNELKREFNSAEISICGTINIINSTLEACYNSKIFVNGQTSYITTSKMLRNIDTHDNGIYNFTAYMFDYPTDTKDYDDFKRILNRENNVIKLIRK